VRLPEPEDLGESDVLAEALVAEPAEDHRVVVVVAQRDRFGREACLAALGFVVAKHIGSEVALA
jgi:hypothetical protein